MSATQITLVFSFRDRPLTAVRRCLESLADQTYRNFSVIIVDYGSRPEFARDLLAATGRHPFCRVLRAETTGWLWNRAHALNIGIRAATSSYVATTDIDLIFPPEHLAVCARQLAEHTMLYCFPTRLPENFERWGELSVETKGLPEPNEQSLGAFHLAPAAALRRVRGFDETYCVWGREDRDLYLRLLGQGLRAITVNDRTAVFHQWHETAATALPVELHHSFFLRSTSYLEQNRGKTIRNHKAWGKQITLRQRPLSRLIDLASGKLARQDAHAKVVLKSLNFGALTRTAEMLFSLQEGEAMEIQLQNPEAAGLFRAVSTELILQNRAHLADYYLDGSGPRPRLVLLRRVRPWHRFVALVRNQARAKSPPPASLS